MIIQKELIDASINSKRAAQNAHNEAMLAAILSKLEELEKLPQILEDIIQTFDYVHNMDNGISSLMWNAMCSYDSVFGIDLCNAVMTNVKGGGYAIRPDYSRKGCFRNLYVLRIGVYFCGERDDLDSLFPIKRVSEILGPGQYESMLNSICLLLEAIPAYRDKLAEEFNKMLK